MELKSKTLLLELSGIEVFFCSKFKAQLESVLAKLIKDRAADESIASQTNTVGIEELDQIIKSEIYRK